MRIKVLSQYRTIKNGNQLISEGEYEIPHDVPLITRGIAMRMIDLGKAEIIEDDTPAPAPSDDEGEADTPRPKRTRKSKE